MKSSIPVLLLSVAANLALGTVLFTRARISATPVVITGIANTQLTVPANASAPSTPSPFEKTWETLNDGSDADFVARLRAEGFPPKIVWALASSRLHQRYAARRAALAEGGRIPPYWRNQIYESSGRTSRDPEIRAQQRALDDEFEAEFKLLLGSEDAGMSDFMTDYRRRQYGDLPPNKIRQLEVINRDYNELNSQVRGESLGIIFPEDQAQLDLLEQEKRADLQRTLSPEEFEAYDLRSGEIASNLRWQLAVFDPSEAEFRALAKVQQAYNQRYKGQTLTADESREAREAMVATVLTPERLAEYQVKTAGAYRPLTDLVTQLHLPQAAVGDVINVQRDIMRRVGVVNSDTTLTTAQRDTQLAVLAREATTKITASLGKEGLNTYKAMIGTWLQKLPSPEPESPKL